MRWSRRRCGEKVGKRCSGEEERGTRRDLTGKVRRKSFPVARSGSGGCQKLKRRGIHSETTPEGGVLLGLERPRTYEDLSDTKKKRYDADVRATNIVLQGLPQSYLQAHTITTLKQKLIWDNVQNAFAGLKLTKERHWSTSENINEFYVRFHKLVNDMRNIRMTMPNFQLNSKFVNNTSPEWDRQWGAHNRAGNANGGQGKPVKCYNCNGNGAVLDEEELLFLVGEQGNTFDADVDNQPVQDLALNEDNIFQADESDAFDSDVDDEPTAQTIFMANLS
ncbi:hypothetical protein Tco_1162604 [Tanacetum coccineum]